MLILTANDSGGLLLIIILGLNQSAGVGLCWSWTGSLNNLMSYRNAVLQWTGLFNYLWPKSCSADIVGSTGNPRCNIKQTG